MFADAGGIHPLRPRLHRTRTPAGADAVLTTVGVAQKFDSLLQRVGLVLSLDGLIRATGHADAGFCTGCFSGKYPVDIQLVEKETFER